MRHWLFGSFTIGLAALSPAWLAALPAHALPAGFQLVTVATGFHDPTAFAFKGAKILVTEKGSGKVLIVRPDGSVRAEPFITVSVNTLFERGLLGIALDPEFATNHYIYLYYTTGPAALAYSGSPMNRVSRFTGAGGVGVDETIILDNIPSDFGTHNGGDIQFGFDGMLYVAVGDGGTFHDDALTLDSLRGKILRVNRDGKPPLDNPHKLDPGARRCGKPGGAPVGTGPCKEIWAYGFRNPFRFSQRQATSSYVVADVGQDTWEELDALVPDGNYGWNAFEGPCPLLPNPNCDPSTTPYPAEFQRPIHFYNHTGVGETGETIIAGAFAENGSNYPEPYADAYFYGDFSNDWVHVLTMKPDKNKVTGQLDFGTLNAPVDFANGPDGNIYVLSIFDGALYKYVYTPP